MNDTEIIQRYWTAFRHAIENYVKACDENKNGTLIHCLAQVVRLRESELDRAEGKTQGGH
jgi:hypothetical protein